MEGLFPFDIDHFDDTINFRTAYKTLFESIVRLGVHNYELLKQCAEEDERHEKEMQEEDNYLRTTFVSEVEQQQSLRKLYSVWLEYFVTYTESMREVQMYIMDGKKIKTTLGLHVFTELTRLNYLINRPRLMVDMYEEEMQSLEKTRHPFWIVAASSFDISGQYEEKEDKDADVESRLLIWKALWSRPIMRYSQVQVEMVILFLTQQLNEVTSESVVEFKSIVDWLWLRICELQKELHPKNILDSEHMRQLVLNTDEGPLFSASKDFGVFVTYYMGEICRRLYYYELLSKRCITQSDLNTNLKTKVEKCKAWIEHVIHFFAEEAFTDLYVESCADAYAFVGDDYWFKYSNAQKVHSRAACLAELRPHLYRRYFSESRASRESILSSINTSHISRSFVLKAISQYIQIKLGGASAVKWYQGVVLHSNDIYMSAYNLRANMAPFLLQVLSTYWAYDQGRVWKCDDFYESLAVWFHLLRTRYNSTLFGHDLSRFVDAAIGLKEDVPLVRNQEFEHTQLPVGFLL